MLIDRPIGKATVKWISQSLLNRATVSSRWARSASIEAVRRRKRSQSFRYSWISGRYSPRHLSPSRTIASLSFFWECSPMASISSGDDTTGTDAE
jgi:hypothetical protein